MSDQPCRPVFFWLVLLTCVVYAGSLAFTVYAVARYYGVEKAPGWIAQTDGRAWYVSDVDDAGPAAGRIQRGDRLLAINGDERYAVEEFYFYDPDTAELTGWRRAGGQLQEIPVMKGWISPRLGVRFDLEGDDLVLYRPDGARFLTFVELHKQHDDAARRAEREATRAEREATRASAAEDEAQRLRKLLEELQKKAT